MWLRGSGQITQNFPQHPGDQALELTCPRPGNPQSPLLAVCQHTWECRLASFLPPCLHPHPPAHHPNLMNCLLWLCTPFSPTTKRGAAQDLAWMLYLKQGTDLVLLQVSLDPGLLMRCHGDQRDPRRVAGRLQKRDKPPISSIGAETGAPQPLLGFPGLQIVKSAACGMEMQPGKPGPGMLTQATPGLGVNSSIAEAFLAEEAEALSSSGRRYPGSGGASRASQCKSSCSSGTGGRPREGRGVLACPGCACVCSRWPPSPR